MEHFCFPPRVSPATPFRVTNNPVYLLFHSNGNIGPFLLRIAVAGIFFYHGAQKALGWFGGPGWSATIAKWETAMSYPPSITISVMVGELLIALSLWCGFLTRLSGLGVAIIMTGAVFTLAGSGGGIAEVEFPFLVGICGLSLLFLGGGGFSIDRAISKNLLPVVG